MRRVFGLGAIAALLVAFLPATAAQAAPTSTTTVVEAPNQFGINDSMPIRVQVTSNSGTAAPTGSVSLYSNTGTRLATSALTTSTSGYSSAIMNIWYQSLGLQKLRAVYTPSSADFAGSESTYAGTMILSSTPLAVLRMPDRFVVGTQANLTALISPAGVGGSATFNANNRQYFASTPNVNGQINFPWTPTTSTQYTFVINYTNEAGDASMQVRQPTFAFPN